MPEILKSGKVVGTFTHDPDSHAFSLHTADAALQRVSRRVPGVKSEYIPETDTMLSVLVELQPGDLNYAFHFLSQLIESGYEVKE